MGVRVDAVLPEQLLHADLIAEELPGSSIDVDVGDQRPDERGREVDVAAGIQHPFHIDGCSHGEKQAMAVAVVMVLLLPQPTRPLLHSSTVGGRSQSFPVPDIRRTALGRQHKSAPHNHSEHRSAARSERSVEDLLATGKINGTGLAPKTVYDVHVIMRAALKHAVQIHLVEHNVALDATAPRPTAQAKQGPESWTFDQLRTFLAATQHLRLYPALHLAATTGMRRGELAGLRWGDWNQTTHSISVARARQSGPA